jgi:hypothetical protein
MGLGSTTLPTADDPGATPPFYARVDDEIVLVTSVSLLRQRWQVRRAVFGTTRAVHEMTSVAILDWLDGALSLGDDRYALVGHGAPTDGAGGTGDLVAGAGSSYTDLDAGIVYVASAGEGGLAWRAGTGAGSTVRVGSAPPTDPPSGGELPIAFDNTSGTGGLYVWDGAAWQYAALGPTLG